MSLQQNKITILFIIIFFVNTFLLYLLFAENQTVPGKSKEIQIEDKGQSVEGKSVKLTSDTPLKFSNNSSGFIDIEAMSSKTRVSVAVNNIKIYERDSHRPNLFRGIHVVVINQFNGRLMMTDVFDTYSHDISGQLLVELLGKVQNGRIIVLTIGDDGSRKLERERRVFLLKYGSLHVEKLNFRSTWVFCFIKGFMALKEDYHSPISYGRYAKPSFIRYQKLPLKDQTSKCKWSKNSDIRSYFCSKYEGYGSLCSCHHPDKIKFTEHTIRKNIILPIIVMASDRARYLYRMLRTLLQTAGVIREHILVFIDGFFDETTDVARLLNVSFINNFHVCQGACGISQNYKRSIRYTFDKYKHTQYAIILEEDLEVSPDIMDYFHQLLPILESDDSLFCISAWNDLGYKHSSNDSTLLYRVELFPGLGWILKRKIFEDELEPNWPSANTSWHWDVWLRFSMMKGRECIIPDVSRTFHYGVSGVNMNVYFHAVLFQNRVLNKQTGIKFDLNKIRKEEYEISLHAEIKSAIVLDHFKDPCKDKGFIPSTKNKTYVFYIYYSLERSSTWKRLAQCFGLWSLSPRSYHKEMFRFWLKENKIFVVSSTSPYAIYKPQNIIPYYISDL